jgi:PrcB C-terminal
LTIARETKRLFREEGVFSEYVARAGGQAPRVDFDRRQLLLVSPGPRSSTGYAMEILGVVEQDGELTVTVRERTPGPDDRIEPRVTFPYRLLSLPPGREVYVDWPGR